LKSDTPILVSGEVAADESLRKILQEATGHEVSILTPMVNLPPEAPALMFSTCVGLVAKKIPKFMDKLAYHDIDVNVLIRTKKQSQLKFILAYAGIGLLFLLLAGVVYKSYDLKIEAAARTEALRKESTRATQLLVDAQKSNAQAQATRKENEDKLQSLANELNVISGEHKYIKNLQYDYARSINLINISLPAGAYYREINMKPGMITVTGEVLDKFDVLTFTEAMERTTVFSSVRVESLEPLGEDNPGVKFTVVLTK
jgi:Tfp pilus assembly protein PilN